MGYPSETLEDLKASIAFIKWQEFILASRYEKDSEKYKLACASVNKNLFVATAYPGTEMFKEKTVQEKLFLNSLFFKHFSARVCSCDKQILVN